MFKKLAVNSFALSFFMLLGCVAHVQNSHYLGAFAASFVAIMAFKDGLEAWSYRLETSKVDEKGDK